MKQLKPRDKVTQHMTRDGLTLDNQTTGESINISSREAEQDYSAAEPDIYAYRQISYKPCIKLCNYNCSCGCTWNTLFAWKWNMVTYYNNGDGFPYIF